jgi:hypothetical protein
VTFDYATQDGTAKAGVDYTPVSGTLTIPPGKLDADVEIAILNSGSKTPRTFTLVLSNPTIAKLDPLNVSTITINPEEVPVPRVILTAAESHASRNGPVPGVFTLTRDAGLDKPLTVYYTVSGTAVPGFDYLALPGILTFQPGQDSASILVIPLGGNVDKLVTLTLTPNASYLLGRSSATVGISGSAPTRMHLPLIVR